MERAAENRPGDWTCPACEHHNFARRDVCRNCNTSKATNTDWICPSCSFNNFGRNRACIKCGQANAPSPVPTQVTVKPGDWVCTCGEVVFASRFACRRCGARKPTPTGFGMSPYERPAYAYTDMPTYAAPTYGAYAAPSYTAYPPVSPAQRPGDWTCSCGEHVFASRNACRRCGQAKPFSATPAYAAPPPSHAAPVGRPNDWVCTCGELVFASRPACRRCGNAKPAGSAGSHFSGATAHNNMQPGDWICKDCGDLQFASRTQCRRCGSAKTE